MEQKIKNYLGIAGTVGIIIVAIAGWRYVGAYADSLQPGSYRSFSVSGEGKSVAIPDIASFSFGVITEGGKDVTALQTQNTERINKAISFLKDQGIEEKDIKTEGYNLQPRYQYSNCSYLSSRSDTVCPPPAIVGYTVTQTVSVKVRELKKAGDILSGVVNNGANNVSQLNFTLDDPEAAKAAARTEAFDKAKAKAKAIADEGGFRVGRLVSVSVNDGNGPIIYGMGAGSAEDAYLAKSIAPSPTIEVGSQDVKVSVYQTYEIK